MLARSCSEGIGRRASWTLRKNGVAARGSLTRVETAKPQATPPAPGPGESRDHAAGQSFRFVSPVTDLNRSRGWQHPSGRILPVGLGAGFGRPPFSGRPVFTHPPALSSYLYPRGRFTGAAMRSLGRRAFFHSSGLRGGA